MLSREEYEKNVKRPYPPLLFSIIMHGLFEADNYRPAIQKQYAVVDTLKSDDYIYYTTRDLKKLNRIIFQEWTNKAKIQEAQKIFEEREKVLFQAAAGTSFTSFCQAYEYYIPAIMLVWKPAEDIENIITDLLFKQISKQDTGELMNVLNIPLEDNYYKQEEYDLITCQDINKHVEKYSFIYSRYGEYHPYTVKDAKKRLENVNRSEFLQKRQTEKVKVKEAVTRAKQILGKKDEYLIDFMQFIVYYRTRRTDVINRAAYIFMPQLEKMAAARNLAYKQLLYCLKEEVLGDLPSLAEIKARIKDYAIVMEVGQIRCLSGQESAKLREFLKEDLGDIKEFKGTVASPVTFP